MIARILLASWRGLFPSTGVSESAEVYRNSPFLLLVEPSKSFRRKSEVSVFTDVSVFRQGTVSSNESDYEDCYLGAAAFFLKSASQSSSSPATTQVLILPQYPSSRPEKHCIWSRKLRELQCVHSRSPLELATSLIEN